MMQEENTINAAVAVSLAKSEDESKRAAADVRRALVRAFGSASDTEQAELLNDLSESLRAACGGRADAEMQTMRIASCLGAGATVFVCSLAEFIELEKGDPR